MKKKIIIFALIILLIILASYFVLRPVPAVPLNSEEAAVCGQGEGCTISKKRVQGFNVGDQIPNLALTDFNGETTYLYDMLAGKEKFILSLAVDWCSDCERQDQKLDQYYPKLPYNYGAAVLFVDYSSSDGSKTTSYEQTLAYVNEKNYSFPTFWDKNKTIANDFGGVKATPTNIVLDENGIIKAKAEEIDMDILFNTNDSEYSLSILEEKR